MIARFPENTDALQAKKQLYEEKLYKSEMVAGAPPPWTVKTLTDYIAVDMARAPLGSQRRELSATEHTPTCKNCGEKHHPMSCPHKCKECGNAFCPGNPIQCMVCAVVCDIPPSQRKSEILNFFKQQVPDFLIRKLDAAWKLKHPDRTIPELSLLEAKAQDSDSDDDDLYVPGSRFSVLRNEQ